MYHQTLLSGIPTRDREDDDDKKEYRAVTSRRQSGETGDT